MPVEEHPAYQEWREALDELKEAADALDLCRKSHAPEAEIEAARERLTEAQVHYDRARDKIGIIDEGIS